MIQWRTASTKIAAVDSVLRELLTPKVTESQQRGLLSRYEMESPRPLDDKMKNHIMHWTTWQPTTALSILRSQILLQQALFSATCAKSLGAWLPDSGAKTTLRPTLLQLLVQVRSQPQWLDLKHASLDLLSNACHETNYRPTTTEDNWSDNCGTTHSGHVC